MASGGGGGGGGGLAAPRTDVKNAAIFSAAGSGTAIWAGAGVTRTRASPTIFISGVPPHIPLERVEALFSGERGFLAFRVVRRMVFVDFRDETCSLAAMRK
jgi:hypothetical protein